MVGVLQKLEAAGHIIFTTRRRAQRMCVGSSAILLFLHPSEEMAPPITQSFSSDNLPQAWLDAHLPGDCSDKLTINTITI